MLIPLDKALLPLTAILFLVFAGPAEARYHHARHHHNHIMYGEEYPSSYQQQMAQYQIKMRQYRTQMAQYQAEMGHVVGHPAGCPGHAFCGCGVSVRVFGHPVRNLFLASNWYKFPRSHAAPGNVAIFGNHHVAYIERVDANGNALLYDPNSGGHATRVHTRSLAGATIVNPRG